MRDAQIEQLERWVKAGNTLKATDLRSMIILETNRGQSAKALDQTLGVSQPTIRRWKQRFAEGGPQALTMIAPGRRRKPRLSRQKVSAVVQATQHTTPPGQTHWSGRTMAQAKGLSFKTVQRIWHLPGRKPHQQKDLQALA